MKVQEPVDTKREEAMDEEGCPVQVAHKIELRPSKQQADYFKQACGTARFVWNWALAEWDRQYKAGEKPTDG